jgi:hypothetical protein
MITPATVVDLGFATWHPWVFFSLLMQFGYILLGFMFSPSCNCCETPADCETSCTGDPPASIEVTITGFANNGCVNCAGLDGLYVLTFWRTTGGGNTCQYLLSPTGLSPCAPATGIMAMRIDIIASGSNGDLLVVLHNGPEGSSPYWVWRRLKLATHYACDLSNLTGGTAPFAAGLSLGGPAVCNATGTTCAVVGIP